MLENYTKSFSPQLPDLERATTLQLMGLLAISKRRKLVHEKNLKKDLNAHLWNGDSKLKPKSCSCCRKEERGSTDADERSGPTFYLFFELPRKIESQPLIDF